MNALSAQHDLKQSIRRGDPTIGLFIRTPALQSVEIHANSGLDFVVLDAEHAAFGTGDLDRCILAGRSIDLPVLVRLRDPTPAAILQVLDMGAAGIILPHVGMAITARIALEACRYDNGSRGFSGQTRAAGYGDIAGSEYRKKSDESIIVIAQIEDEEGFSNVAELAALDELDALFVGRADLAVSLGADNIDDDMIVEATRKILAAGKKSGMTTGIFLNSPDDVENYQQQGASLFIIATDQSLLIDAARSVTTEFRRVTGETS
jgi:2-keto-3-deoxy-L-rhamnonate aldolase RhmA